MPAFMIELRNLTKTFHQKKRTVTALENVKLTIEKGKIFGVIGASGAGKSTLIRCVNLLESPSSGDVIVDGQNLVSLSKKQLAIARRHIGMIFQHFNLLSSRTVFENVAFPLELDNKPKQEIKERVSELLKLVGLEDKSNDYPSNLSGGQKQRVAIARTLANNPKVLLCDEATSALDPETTLSILELLKSINKRLGITILLITHEMQVVKAICDEVAVMSKGRLIEQGTVSAIFSGAETELAKKFISSSIHIDIPDSYKERLSTIDTNGKQPLLKLEFNGLSEDDFAISEAALLFNVKSKIVAAQIDHAGDVKFGTILLELSGTKEQVQKSISFYQSKKITAEVLGYV
jgi:D-methionine transport system ATP-binding protein